MWLAFVDRSQNRFFCLWFCSRQAVENVAAIASQSVTLCQVYILHEADLDMSSECIVGNWLHNSAVFIFIPLNTARKPPCSFISS
jgi:hypothetical protein